MRTNARAGERRFPALLDRLFAASPALVLVGLLVGQGGFFPLTSAWVLVAWGVFLVLWAALRFGFRSGREGAVSDSGNGSSRFDGFSACIPALAFLLIGGLYAASIVVHGLPAWSLVQCAPWALAGVAALVCASLDARQRDFLLTSISWLGIVSTGAGVAMLIGILSVVGSVNAGRLQFFFQYANAAGAWFACAALLCLGARDARLRRWMVLPLTALLFTQSMGSILFFVVVVTGYFLVRVATAAADGRAPIFIDAIALISQGVLAVAAFLFFKLSWGDNAREAMAVVMFLGSVAAFQKFWPRMERALRRGGWGCPALILAVAALVASALLAALAMQGRLIQASATFAERIVQAGDAWRVLVASPGLGIGPDQWQFAYPSIRSAEYEATLVHCSYLQLGLNAGLLAPAVLLTVVVNAMRRMRGRHCGQAPLVIVFLTLHAAVDFDLEFSFFAVLIAIMVGIASGDAENGRLT